MAVRYESLKMIGDRLLRNNVMKGISWDYIIDSTIDFMDIVGVPDIYEDKLFEESFSSYRVSLPCDFAEEIFVIINNSAATSATDPMHQHYNKIGQNSNLYTYRINNGFLFSSVEKGKIVMNYKAIMTDEEGYPLMPADRIFITALEWYIKLQYFTMLWEDAKIEDKRLENAKQEYAWAVGRLESESQRLSLAKAESLFNSFRNLVPRDNEFAKRFGNTGAKEFLKSK